MNRSQYRIIKDFNYPIYKPFSDDLVEYKVGDIVSLRDGGNMATEWLAEGYIEKIEE